MRQVLKSLAAALPIAGMLAFTPACNQGNFDLRGALPEDHAVSINVPGDGTGQGLVGEQSDLYEFTYNVSRGINGSVVVLLGLVRWITLQEPTSQEEDTWTWGPSEPSGLERISWRFQATRVDDGHYTFHLDGRPKGTSTESDFKTVFGGEVFKGESNPQRGHGNLSLNFDNSQALEGKTCGLGNRDVLEGTADVTFAADSEPKKVAVDFNMFRNACDGESVARAPAKYRYEEASDGAGNFQFTAHGNIHAEPSKPALETMTVRSRWARTGAGRSDLTVSSEEVAADIAGAGVVGNSVIVVECWDDMFKLVYQATEPESLPENVRNAIRPTDGQPTACVYTEQQLPDPDL